MDKRGLCYKNNFLVEKIFFFFSVFLVALYANILIKPFFANADVDSLDTLSMNVDGTYSADDVSVVVDDQLIPHVFSAHDNTGAAICGANERYVHAYKESGTWQYECVDASDNSIYANGISAVFVSSGGTQTIYLAYAYRDDAGPDWALVKKVKTPTDESWGDVVWQTLDTGDESSLYGITSLDLTVDANNKLAMAFILGRQGAAYFYYDANGDEDFTAGEKQTIQSGFTTVIKTDQNKIELKLRPGTTNNFGVIYGSGRGGREDNIYFEEYDGDWSNTLKDICDESANQCFSPSFDYDASGNVFVTYGSLSTSVIRYTRKYTRATDTWSASSQVGTYSNNNVWGDGALRVTSDGVVHLAFGYYESFLSTGRYTTSSDGLTGWSSFTNIGNMDKYIEMAERGNYIHLAGNNATNVYYSTDDPGNIVPVATTPTSTSQATNGTGYVTFETTVSDSDSQDTKLKVEYSDDGGSTWYDPDLVSVTPSSGSVSLSDVQTYQIGATDLIDSSGGSITLSIVWDTKSASNGNGSLDSTDQSDIQVRVTPNDMVENGAASASASFEVDDLDPTQPGNLVDSAITESSIDVTFGAQSTDTNFSEYKIFYSQSTPVTTADNEFSKSTTPGDTDLDSVTYGGTVSTTLSGLVASTPYYVNIWAYDNFGNTSVAAAEITTTTNSGFSPPVATIPTSISQATDGTGYLTFQTTISDADNENTQLKIEYSDNGGTTWYDPYIISGTPNSGSVNLDNTHPYQLGSVDVIDTATGPITLTIVWDTKSVSNGHGSLDTTDQTDIKVRVTPNDGSVDANSVGSALFEVDNLDPSVPGNLTLNTANATTAIFDFGSAVVESHFFQYKIFYKQGAAGVGESDTAFTSSTDSDLGIINYGGTANTTLSSLSINTQYVANIWAYDNFGNSASGTTELAFYTSADTPGAPAVAVGTATTLTVTINQATNPASITYYICKTDDETSCADNGYVQSADGSLGASADWQTYATWGGASGISVTGLATSTAYQFLVKARNSENTETGFSSANTAVSTLAVPPGAPVVSTISESSLNVIVDQATNSAEAEYEICQTSNGTSCVAGSYVQADGSLGVSAVWQTHADWDGASGVNVTGLAANTTYQFIVKARNADSVETTFSAAGSGTTQAQSGGSGNGGNPNPQPPTQDPTGSLSINNGDVYTRNLSVTITFTVQNTNEYMVSEDQNFMGLSYVPIATSTPFILSGGDGTKKVYTKFKNQSGTYTTSSTIVLDTASPIITLMGSSTVYVDIGSEYNELGAQAQDALAGNVDVLINSSRVDTSKVGFYNVTYVATDEAGNPATALRQVVVREPSEEDVTMIVNRGNRYYNHYRVVIFLFSEVDMVRYKSAATREGLEGASFKQIPTSVPEYKRVYDIVHEMDRTEGEHTIFVQVETSSGEQHVLSGNIILDFTPPIKPVISSLAYPRIRGTATPGDRVKIMWGRKPRTAYINGLHLASLSLAASPFPDGFIPTAQRNTTADENGNWEFVFPILQVDEYVAGLNTEDLAGNTSGYVVSNFVVERQLPSICGNAIVEGGEACDGSAPQGFVCTANCTLVPEETEPEDTEPDTEPHSQPDSQPDSNPDSNPGSDTNTSDASQDSANTNTSASNENTQDTVTLDNRQEREDNLFERAVSFVDSFGSASGTQAVILRAVEGTVAAIRQVINNPKIEETNEKIAAPVLATVAVANVATAGFGVAQTAAVLRSFFGQIFLLFRRRKQKKWGTVYHAFTKRPIDLAIVRLLDARTNQIVRTQVTDSQGRYYLTANPGMFRIEVTKDGFEGFSRHLKTLDEDTTYTQLYHGESFTLTEEQTDIHFAIPLDPIGVERPATQIIRDMVRKKIRFVFSIIGLVAAIISFIISPAWWIILLMVLHGFIYLIFYKLAYHKMPDSFGKVLSFIGHKPLGKVVIRVFDATYNKLVDTAISDHKGRYAILVGPSTYYVTYEKPLYEKKKSPTIDFSSERTHGRGGIIDRDETLEKEKNIQRDDSSGEDKNEIDTQEVLAEEKVLK